jgi:hypothetical protein
VYLSSTVPHGAAIKDIQSELYAESFLVAAIILESKHGQMFRRMPQIIDQRRSTGIFDTQDLATPGQRMSLSTMSHTSLRIQEKRTTLQVRYTISAGSGVQ